MGRIKHGHTTKAGVSSTYVSWVDMLGRVRSHPKGYEHVDMDPRWNDFTIFYVEMGDRPEGKTLHRKDGNKGYWPWNCIWATRSEQQQALRKRVPPIGAAYARGMADKMSQKEIAQVLGCSQVTIHNILKGNSGFEPAKDRVKFQQHNSITPLGAAYIRGMRNVMSMRDIAKVIGCGHSSVSRFINRRP